jgi:superfamily II DNA helicase RecQ
MHFNMMHCVSAYEQIAQTAGSCGPVSIVVSPLVSLVHDQVTALQNNGVAACALKVRT